MNKIPLYAVHSFQNDTGTLVNKQVESGLTRVFTMEEKSKAEEYAKKSGSYSYNLWCNITVEGKNKTILYGYAVPK
jgi:hypothetical protein